MQSLRVVAPIMPFLADHLWRNLVAGPCAEAPSSVHLSPWPEVDEALADDALLEEIAAVRRVVELGRQARASRNVKLRQPLRRAVVYGGEAARGHAGEIAEELRVEDVSFESGEEARVRYKPNLPLLGPRLGSKLPAVRKALEEGRFQVEGENVVAEGETLGPDELLREREPVNEGWATAYEGDLSVELDTELDDELVLEGRVLDLIRQLNEMRKTAGLELTDRIRVRLPREHAELEPHFGRIAQEVLAVEIELDGGAPEPAIEKV